MHYSKRPRSTGYFLKWNPVLPAIMSEAFQKESLTFTKSAQGRVIGRSFFEDTSQRLQASLNTPELRIIYKKRGQKVELPFGHLRRTLGIRSFLLRGLAGAKAELSLWGSAFNIRRMITLFGGVQSFIAAFGTWGQDSPVLSLLRCCDRKKDRIDHFMTSRYENRWKKVKIVLTTRFPD